MSHPMPGCMRLRRVLVMLATLAAAPTATIASAQDARAVPPAPWITRRVEAPRVQFLTFPSAAAGTDVSCHVYVPEAHDADPDRRLPVVYWLHGTSGGLPGIAPLADWFDAAITAGTCPPLLVVFANGLVKSMWCDAVDGSAAVESVVVKDLVPFIDATFRTVASREGRLVEGFSMGGYGAARLGFKHPGVFGAVSILAGGPLDPEFAGPRAQANPEGRDEILTRVFGDMEGYLAASPWILAEQNAATLRDATVVRIAVGDRDFTAAANRRFAERLDELRIPHEFTVVPRVGHDTPALLRGLGAANWGFYRRCFAGRDELQGSRR